MLWILRMVVLSTLLTTTTLAIPSKVPTAPVVHSVTIDDKCLAWVIDNEARGEPIIGQRAVLDVVKYRMRTRNMTACQVVKEPYQFSAFHRGMTLKTTKEMLHKLDDVRKIKPVVPNAVAFHNNTVHPTWADRLRKVTTIGKHAFYSLRKGQQPKERNK